MKKITKKALPKRPKKPAKPRKPKPLPVHPVVVWEAEGEGEPPRDWLDKIIDKVAGWLKWRL
jgi:hypothetical protein